MIHKASYSRCSPTLSVRPSRGRLSLPFPIRLLFFNSRSLDSRSFSFLLRKKFQMYKYETIFDFIFSFNQNAESRKIKIKRKELFHWWPRKTLPYKVFCISKASTLSSSGKERRELVASKTLNKSTGSIHTNEFSNNRKKEPEHTDSFRRSTSSLESIKKSSEYFLPKRVIFSFFFICLF